MFEDRRIMEHFVVLIQHNALKSDSTEYTNPVTYEVERSEEITSLFGSNIYEKGEIYDEININVSHMFSSGAKRK